MKLLALAVIDLALLAVFGQGLPPMPSNDNSDFKRRGYVSVAVRTNITTITSEIKYLQIDYQGQVYPSVSISTNILSVVSTNI